MRLYRMSFKKASPIAVSKRAVIAAVNAIMMAGTMHAQSAGSPAPAAGEAPVKLGAFRVDDSTSNPQVASPKFTEAILDTPQTVVAITPEVFAPQGAATLSDVLRNTPGITFFAGEGGGANRTGGDSFYLRGFDTSNSIFIDGVRDEGALVHDTFNLDQVDVIKGPSADNGRGGTAGYINLETKLPKAAAFESGEFSTGFDRSGSEAIGRGTVDLNQPLAGSPVPGSALRLNLMDQAGGVTGRQRAENNRWGVAPSLALGLGTPTRAFLGFQHEYEHNLPDYGLPSTAVAGLAPPAAAGAASFFSPGVDPANYYGFATIDYEHVTNDALTARVEHDFAPGVTLANQTREDETERRVESTSPSGSVTAAPAGQAALTHGIFETRNEILSNQTNLTAGFATGPVKHTLTAGLELSRETADNPAWAAVPLGVANPNTLVDIYHPNNLPAALLNYAPHRTGADTDTRIDTSALYAFDTVKAGQFWELTGGLRLEHYDVDELSLTAASPAIAATAARPATATTPATASTAAVAAVAASRAELTAAKTTVSGKAGARLQAGARRQPLSLLRHVGPAARHLGIDQHPVRHRLQRRQSPPRARKGEELRGGGQVGVLRRPPERDPRPFPQREHGRARHRSHLRARRSDLQPDRAGRGGRRLGQDHRRVARLRRLLAAGGQGLRRDQHERPGPDLAAPAQGIGQPVDDLCPAVPAHLGRWRPVRR